MITIDGASPFESGPCRLEASSWTRQTQRRGFAGLDGELVLDQGRRARKLTQSGRLQAATAQLLAEQIAAIESLIDGRAHTIVDNLGITYANVLVESFELRGGVVRGRGFWCDYQATYLQLP